MTRIVRRGGDVPARSLWQRIKDVALTDVGVLARGGVRVGSLEQLEELLLSADFGVPVTLRLVDEVSRRAQRGEIRTDEEFRDALRADVEAALRSGRSDPTLRGAPPSPLSSPTVILVVGVNGAGKTTFIGKLSERLRIEGGGASRAARGGGHVSRGRDRAASAVGRAHRRGVCRRDGRRGSRVGGLLGDRRRGRTRR